jgi:hypothetical protein
MHPKPIKMPTNKKVTSFCAALFLCTSFVAFAQTNTDFETWSSINVEVKLHKKLKLELEEQLRLKENSSEIDQYFTQIGLSYQFPKDFEIGGGLRFAKKNDNTGKKQGYDSFFRYHIDLAYKHKQKRFNFKHRLRFQNKNEIGVSEAEEDNAKKNLRLKSSVSYNVRNWKLDPQFSAEIFNNTQQGKENGFHKYRLTLGSQYSFKKWGQIDLFFRLEQSLNAVLIKSTKIIGFSYIYAFDK